MQLKTRIERTTDGQIAVRVPGFFEILRDDSSIEAFEKKIASKLNPLEKAFAYFSEGLKAMEEKKFVLASRYMTRAATEYQKIASSYSDYVDETQSSFPELQTDAETAASIRRLEETDRFMSIFDSCANIAWRSALTNRFRSAEMAKKTLEDARLIEALLEGVNAEDISSEISFMDAFLRKS